MSVLQYGKIQNNTINTFFDILKQPNLKPLEIAYLCDAKQVRRKIDFQTKSTNNKD